MKLPFESEAVIAKYVHDHRMEWELWIESANSYADLQKSLIKRGIKHFPYTDKPKMLLLSKSVADNSIKGLPNQNTMMRRGKT